MFTKEMFVKLGSFLFFTGLACAMISGIDILPFTLILEEVGSALIPLGVLSWIGSGFVSSKKKKVERKILSQLENCFVTSNYARVSSNVVLKKEDELTSLKNVSVFYDEDRVCTLDEYLDYSKEDYKKILENIQMPTIVDDFVDENKNGVDDRKENAQNFIEQIMVLKNSIKNEQIQEGLEQVIKQLKDIKYLETKYENILPKLSKLYERYLPILISILESYVQLLYTNTSSGEITYTEEKLKKTIILVNEALTSIKTELIKDDIMNLSTDMSVLEMVLKQDGLVEDDLTMLSKKE